MEDPNQLQKDIHKDLIESFSVLYNKMMNEFKRIEQRDALIIDMLKQDHLDKAKESEQWKEIMNKINKLDNVGESK